MQMIHEIYPRRYRGHWLFDDPRHEIVDEEFVYGMDTILDILCAKKRNLSRGIRLAFSNEPLPGSLRLDWRGADAGGDWYIANEIQITGWCCPTLLKYFPEGAPKELYLKISFLKGDESWESLLSSQRSQG
jgi:hypothetical protein